MSVTQLTKPLFIEVRRLGQIGCGKVVSFTPRGQKKWISLPAGARSFDKLEEFEVCGDSLEDLYIFDGDTLICRTNFEYCEIKPNRVCIIRFIKTNDLSAKMVQINVDGTVTILSGNIKYAPYVCFTDEIEVLALAIETKRRI